MNEVRLPIRNVNTISENTKTIIEVLLHSKEKQALPKPPSQSLKATASKIPFNNAIKTGRFESVGMGLWKGGMKEDDYGRIWVKKTFVDEKTGEKQEWLVVYTNDEDEIIRQVASEYKGIQKAASYKKANEDKVPLKLVGLDGNAFSILGAFQSAAREHGWEKEKIKAVLDQAMSGDYNNLLNIIMNNTYDPSEEDYDEFDDLDEINNDDYDELQMDDDADVVSSKKTAFNTAPYQKYPQYRKYFTTLQTMKDTYYYGKPMAIQTGAAYLVRQHPELDETEANRILNIWLGEVGPYEASRKQAAKWYSQYFLKTEDPYEEGYEDTIQSRNNVTVFEFPSEKLLMNFLEEVGGTFHPYGGLRAIITTEDLKKEAANVVDPIIITHKDNKFTINDNGEIFTFPSINLLRRALVKDFNINEDNVDDIIADAIKFKSVEAANVDPKNIPIAPGIKSKDLKLNESGGAGTGTVTIEFTDVNKALKFYQDEVTPAGGEKQEVPQEENQEGMEEQEGKVPSQQPQQGTQVQVPPGLQVQPKASSLAKKAFPYGPENNPPSDAIIPNNDEDRTEDQFGQYLYEGDRVKDDMGRRGTIDRIVGNAVYVTWGGPFEGGEQEGRHPVLMDAKQLTKWASLKPTVEEFSDGLKGVRVIRYSNYNPRFSSTVWELMNRERINSHATSSFSSNTSYINENGMEIPVSLKTGIKVGEMFERPDNHELVRFAGWINKTAIKDNGEPEDDYNDIHDTIDSYKEDEGNTSEGETAELDIHIEAEPDIIENMIDNLLDGLDADQLEGGLADDREDEEFDEDQLEKGKDVEKEHTDDEDLAKEIAKDHLMEMGDYYDKLEDMEKKESKLATIVEENGKWKVKNKAKTKTLGTHNTKKDAEKQLQAIEINKHAEYHPGEEVEVEYNAEKDLYCIKGKKTGKTYKELSDEMDAEKEADFINKLYKEKKFTSLNKQADHYVDPNFGLWVASLGNSLRGEKLDQYHNILAQFLPEFGHNDYQEIVKNTDTLQMEQKKQLEEHLYNLIGKQEFANKKLSFDDPYETQSDFYDDKGSYDKFLTDPNDNLNTLSVGDRVRVSDENSEQFGEEGTITDTLEFNAYRVDMGSGEDYKFYSDELTKVSSKTSSGELTENDFYSGMKVRLKPEYASDNPSEVFTLSNYDGRKGWIGDDQDRGWYAEWFKLIPVEDIEEDIEEDDNIDLEERIKQVRENRQLRRMQGLSSKKTAADISDEIPPMTNVTNESQADSPAPNQQPLPPKPELNNQPGDVLYDSNKQKQDAGKFQVTTDPVEKTVTVKFLDEDKSNALDNLMNPQQQQLNPLMQNQQQPAMTVPGQAGFQPEKDFQDVNSGVQY